VLRDPPPQIALRTVPAVFPKRLASALVASNKDTTHGTFPIVPAPPDAGVARPDEFCWTTWEQNGRGRRMEPLEWQCRQTWGKDGGLTLS